MLRKKYTNNSGAFTFLKELEYIAQIQMGN